MHIMDCAYMYIMCSCLIIIPVHAGTLTVLKSLFSHSRLRSNQIVLISTDCEFMCSPVVIVLFQYPYFHLQLYPCLCHCVLYMLSMYMWSTFNPLSFLSVWPVMWLSGDAEKLWAFVPSGSPVPQHIDGVPHRVGAGRDTVYSRPLRTWGEPAQVRWEGLVKPLG